MKTKRSLYLLLVALLTVTLLPYPVMPVWANDSDSSGSCGETLYWALDSVGTLTIFGAGEMDDYSETEHAPWYGKRGSICDVTVEEGVTGLGNYAFDGCSSLEYIFLPDSLERVGDEEGYVFRGCNSLGMIEVNSGNETFYSDGGVLLGDNCLYRYPPAKDDKYYCIPEDTYGSIMAGAFAGADQLERLYIPEISNLCFPIFEGCVSLTKLYIGGDAGYMVSWESDLLSDLPGEGISIL